MPFVPVMQSTPLQPQQHCNEALQMAAAEQHEQAGTDMDAGDDDDVYQETEEDRLEREALGRWGARTPLS